jgi:CheY-like chemotaxis protein
MGFRIVAVDDNPVVTLFIAAILGQAGHDVETASSAAEGLVTLQRNPPDLLLLDLEMPGLDGLELLGLMKEKRICEGIPVLLLTAQNDYHFVNKARELGATGYLTKPFEARDLTAKVARVLTDADTVWLDDYHAVTRGQSVA